MKLNKKYLLLISLLVIILLPKAIAQISQVNHRVYLLGNTVDINLESEFYNNLAQLLNKEDPFTVLINGDLIDTKTSKIPTSLDSLKIRKLLEVVAGLDNGQVIIIPGDRDWASSGKKGWESANKLQKMIKSMKVKNVKWAISKGCPGPDLIELDENLILVSINTQWWNHPFDKPDPSTAECKFSTERDFLIELENIIEDTEDKNIIVAGHFPLKSLGEYGGMFPLGKHLAPPIYGSLRVGYRQNVGSSMDINNERFEGIRGRIENIILRKGSVIYTAGHEHNLQVLHLEENFMINSGSPVSARYVGKDKENALFAESIAGLVELVYYDNGRVDYRAHQYHVGINYTVFKEQTLFYSPCEYTPDETNFNSAFIPCKESESSNDPTIIWPADSSVIAGNYPAKGLKRVLFGNHYRTSWMIPVRAPYLDLENTFDGLSVYEKGGGHQTTSLKIKGGDGKEYAFRSVDKDPVQLLPYDLQGTIIARVLQDATSMQQPYGAMAIGSMLDATEILHATPTLYLIPPSNQLGPFKEKYSNLLGMLEEKPINVEKVEVPFAEADEILQSRKMFRELCKDHDNKVNAREYAKARMFDILVGDWGKHEDNWKWAAYKKEHGMTYRPIPRDRDYVFSRWDGFLFYLADRKWGLERGENFDYKLKDIRSLTFASQPADRRLFNELDRADWIEAAEYIQTHITNEVITAGVKNMPMEIYEVSGKEIEDKLKQRVKDLDKYAEEYYEQLMIGGVDVVGSNKREYFDVTRNEEGSVRVVMYNTINGEDNKGERLYYDRTFNPKETKEIRLYGLSGKDVFSISGSAKKSIKLSVIGGPDSDVITDQSEVNSLVKKTLIYEKSKNGKIDTGKEAKMVDHWDKSLYNYDRHRFGYNRYLPNLMFGYNNDAGFGVAAGVEFTRKKHTKQDYSSKHKLGGAFTTENINIIMYNGRFHHVLGKWDAQIGGLLADHNNFTFFYGIGNGTIKNDELSSNDFYRTTYNSYGFGTGLIRDFWKKSSLSFTFSYENNETVAEDSTILGQQNPPSNVFGLDDVDLVELLIELDLDFRDREALPEKGTRLYLKHQSGLVTSNDDENYGISQAFLETYATLYSRKPITLGLKFGGSKSYGEETIPFYKLRYLGQNNNLRGFDKNRFTGKSTLYLNSELRFQLAEFRTPIVYMKFGVKGFYDGGRVYSDFDTSDTWHNGYGFGFYVVPHRERFAINVSAAFSEEESALILFRIGSTLR